MRALNWLLLAFLPVAISCKNSGETQQMDTQPIEFKAEASGAIYRGDTLLVNALTLELADTPYERETGLMHRHTMEPKQGMWFIFEEEAQRYFYMKNTFIALDLIYADSNGHIVHIIHNATPLTETSLPSVHPARYVLELNAGSAAAWNLKENDSIAVTRL